MDVIDMVGPIRKALSAFQGLELFLITPDKDKTTNQSVWRRLRRGAGVLEGRDGRRYVFNGVQLRRAVGKPKGKGAVKRAKRERQRGRRLKAAAPAAA